MSTAKPELLLIGGTTDTIRAELDAHYVVHDAATIADLDAHLAEHGAAIRSVATNGHDGCSAAIIDALPNLEIIANYGVGYDAVDVPAAIARGATVTHTPDVLNDDVANTAIALLLATTRDLIRSDAWVRSGDWVTHGAMPLTRTIERRPIGLLGMGRIGQTIAAKLQAAFGCEIHYHSRNPKPDLDFHYHADKHDLARACDAVIVITPGGAATQHLVDAGFLDALGPQGTLINIARGSVVDEAALVTALQNGRIAGAGLDVFEREPQLAPGLAELPNVVLAPHIGSATVETRAAMGQLVLDNLAAHRAGESLLTPVPECRSAG